MVAIVNGRRVQSGGHAGVSTHLMCGTKIYWIWGDMIRRCASPKHQRWSSYGGRGITVCERWQEFANFYADMGGRPDGHSLDRKDNDGPYSPENCRWATTAEQMANRRPYDLTRRTCAHGITKKDSVRCANCEHAAERARRVRREKREAKK